MRQPSFWNYVRPITTLSGNIAICMGCLPVSRQHIRTTKDDQWSHVPTWKPCQERRQRRPAKRWRDDLEKYWSDTIWQKKAQDRLTRRRHAEAFAQPRGTSDYCCGSARWWWWWWNTIQHGFWNTNDYATANYGMPWADNGERPVARKYIDDKPNRSIELWLLWAG